MQAYVTELTELMTGRKLFSIPVYQRNYDWKKENCEQLFFDIEQIAISKRNHFLGTVVYMQDKSTATFPKYIIIDGQQRITSMMLLIKAIHDVWENEDYKADMSNLFLKVRSGVGGYKIKLKPIDSDCEVYEKLIDLNDFNEDYFSEEEKNSNVYINYNLFKKLIYNSKVEIDKLYEALYRLEIVEIQLDKENPQSIFESLNSTGLDLTNTDLLRNYLLMSLEYEKQEEFYKKYWLQIEKLLGSENIEQFMIYYLMLKKKSDSIIQKGKKAKITSKNLYYSYKQIFQDDTESVEKIEKRMKDLLKYANYYRDFIVSDRPKKGYISKLMFELFSDLDNLHASPAMFFFYDKYKNNEITEEDFGEILKIFISYTFRIKVCGGTSGNQFYALMLPKLTLINYDTIFIDKIWEIFNQGKGNYAFPSDIKFRENLENKDLYITLRNDTCRYMLDKIERNRSKEVPDIYNATIEHIMPQTLSSDWKDYLKKYGDLNYDNHEQIIHKLGNLTLTKENSILSNNLFENKKTNYKFSNYSYTRELSKYNKWTSKEIQARSKKLSEVATKIWYLPNKFNQNKTKSNDYFNLNDDFESFTKTRPSCIKINNIEHAINNWTSFYVLTMHELYAINKNLFKDLVHFSLVGRKVKFISFDENDFIKPEKIDLNLYIEGDSHTNTKTVLTLLKDIIDYYGSQDSKYLDLAEKIEFKIK